MSSEPDELLLARAYLSRVAEPANIAVWAWVREHGAIPAAESIRAADVPADVAAATTARRVQADPEADLEAAGRHDIRLVVPESPDWPHFAFAALEACGAARLAAYRRGLRNEAGGAELIPPLALWARGPASLAEAAVRAVALVGSRSASGYGEQVTAELAYGLARREVTVVSGGAYGIDAVAHRAALSATGPTTIVSAGGLDRPYPAGNAGLFEQVADSGLLLSESPPGFTPHRHRFLTRNRLIAALATGTVVVEAAARSGSLNTAAHARNLGRVVMAVPGPVTSATSVGCHALLARHPEPALLVTSVADVLAAVGSAGEGLDGSSGDAWSGAPQVCTAAGAYPSAPGARASGEPGQGVRPARAEAGGATRLRDRLDRLDPVARRVFDGLPARAAVGEDELAARSGVEPRAVIRAIPALELAGLVEVTEQGIRVAPDARLAGVHSTGTRVVP